LNSVDNFVPGKLDELKIGFEEMKNVKPDIIHASISGTAIAAQSCHTTPLTLQQDMAQQAHTRNEPDMML
jgi:crotonobetainyl-CoA:carnitine CoA-transferase CaiB-like acyl-CoA transferase